jgi:hypothetical protein
MTTKRFEDLIELGCKISVPFKEKISDWYSNIEIYRTRAFDDKRYYFISPMGEKYLEPKEAIKEFCKIAFTSKNVGYIQTRLVDKGLDMDRYDFEKPTKQLKKIFKDEGILVDKEFDFMFE